MNLTEAYELKERKIKARGHISGLYNAKLSREITTADKVAIRLKIESELAKNLKEFAKWPEAKELIEEAEDFNAQQIV